VEGWLKHAEELTNVIQCIIEFAKNVEGFKSLDQNDQIQLLKRNTFVLALIAMSQHYDVQHHHLTISGNLTLPVAAYSCSDPDDLTFANQIVDALNSLATMQLTNTETALLSACILLDGVQNTGQQMMVEQLKSVLFSQLSLRVNTAGSGNAEYQYQLLFDSILPQCRHVSQQHMHCLTRFLSFNPQIFEKQPLYRELFCG
jgi:hypothetical protein